MVYFIRSQLSAPSLNLSLTKLTGKKKYNKKPVVGEGVTGTSASVGFPGGEDMLDAFTRLQMLQDTLTEQLEVSKYVMISMYMLTYMHINTYR